MLRHRFAAALLSAIAAFPAASVDAEVLAGPIWNPATGHEYYLLSPNTWAAAETEANALGGNLVAVLDPLENEWVWETFATLSGGPIWIGLNDIELEGIFVWSSGRFTDFTSWWTAGGQPSGDGDAVEMNNYVWNDNDVQAVFPAVAEVVPGGPVRIQVDWSADVAGAVGTGTLSGSFGVFEVPDDGLTFPLPAGAALTASATGFTSVFPNQVHVLDQDVGGLAIRFDSLDPIATTLVSTQAAAYAGRYGFTTPCDTFGCRVIFDRNVTADLDQVRATRFDGTFDIWSAGTPAYRYSVIPEPGVAAAWVAIATLLARRRVAS